MVDGCNAMHGYGAGGNKPTKSNAALTLTAKSLYLPKRHVFLGDVKLEPRRSYHPTKTGVMFCIHG